MKRNYINWHLAIYIQYLTCRAQVISELTGWRERRERKKDRKVNTTCLLIQWSQLEKKHDRRDFSV